MNEQDSDSCDCSDTESEQDRQNEIKIRAHDIQIEVRAYSEAEELSDIAEAKFGMVAEYCLRGEMEAIEKGDISFIEIGD